jgi:hypothetical protein
MAFLTGLTGLTKIQSALRQLESSLSGHAAFVTAAALLDRPPMRPV